MGIFVLLAGVVHFAIQTERDRLAEGLRGRVGSAAIGLISRLEAELNPSVYLATGLAAYINAVRDTSASEIQTALETLYRSGRHIRNIGLAPDNRLTYVFPLAGNEDALGLYYPDLEAQWPAVKRAIDAHHTVLAGPVELRQGGKGLISRTPVFLADGRYWGMLSLVMDADSLFSAAGLRGRVDDLLFALRGRDGMGASGEVINGDPALFQRDVIKLSMPVPGGAWELAARPVEGWRSDQGHLLAVEFVALALSALLAVATLVYQTGRARLADSERRLRLFMDSTMDGVIVLDDDGRVIEFNPAAERLFGYDGDEIIGGSVNLLMPRSDAFHHDRYLRRSEVGESRAMTSSREVMGVKKDGVQFPIEVTVADAKTGDSVIHMGVVRDISERRAFEQQLMALARTDGLTGALNRRAFIETAEDAFRLARRYGHPLSILMIDVDHFKKVNDTFGHPVGDEVLIDLVTRINGRLRATDVFGRMGGEEFIVLLSETPLGHAAEAAERLLGVIRSADRVRHRDQPVHYTVSIGVAAVVDETEDLREVIQAADRALYRAKADGRDRYHTAD